MTGREFADLLIEKGVLVPTSDRRFEVAVPLMADWLDREADPDRKARERPGLNR